LEQTFLEERMEQMNRRELLTAAAVTAAAACACVMASPSTLFADDATQPSTQPAGLDVGLKSDYDKDGITDKFLKSDKVAVVREDGKIYALTAVCTHKGCTIGDATDHFLCPCHKGQFNLDGTVKMGPPKNPLVRYAISVDANKHLVVDKSKSFTPDQATDPASFVTVDA
jgi:cytochrome b6-f complex iron-sulfur subunit